MTQFEVPYAQPEFPKEDLHESNAAYVEYLLRHEQSNRPYADMLRGSLRTMHSTGHQALQLCGITLDYSQAEYEAFCEGFAALEYTTTVIGQHLYDGDLAVTKTKLLFIDEVDMAEFELADRFTAWQQSHPNTYGVIVNDGEAQGETMKQLQARAIGAEMAWELQV